MKNYRKITANFSRIGENAAKRVQISALKNIEISRYINEFDEIATNTRRT